jgi:hypothetical protein
MPLLDCGPPSSLESVSLSLSLSVLSALARAKGLIKPCLQIHNIRLKLFLLFLCHKIHWEVTALWLGFTFPQWLAMWSVVSHAVDCAHLLWRNVYPCPWLFFKWWYLFLHYMS